jgi:hypothetical protein
MLAVLAGLLALTLGVGLLFLQLLATELSRPRDAVWGAVVLLLGLVLVSSSERLSGSPMLAVVCGGLLIGRLGGEVAQARWRQLTPEERARLGSSERWRTALAQLAASCLALLARAAALPAALGAWIAARRRPRAGGKRWVRPEPGAGATPPEAGGEPAAPAAAANAPDQAAQEDRPDREDQADQAGRDGPAPGGGGTPGEAEEPAPAAEEPAAEEPATEEPADAMVVSGFEEIEELLRRAPRADHDEAG